jgi:hypothetical protein
MGFACAGLGEKTRKCATERWWCARGSGKIVSFWIFLGLETYGVVYVYEDQCTCGLIIPVGAHQLVQFLQIAELPEILAHVTCGRLMSFYFVKDE